MVGVGTAGTPAGGVLSIQGVAGGTVVPVSGTITASIPDVSTSGALGSLNATISVTHPGLQSVGMQLAAGTLVGTIVPEASFDGGTTWNPTFFDNPANGNVTTAVSFGSSNTATALTIVGVGGAGMTRVRVSAYTSGTANVTVRASDINDPSLLSGGAPGAALPPVIQQVGGPVTTGVPTYSTGTFNALSLNTSGGLRVDGSAVTQPVSGTVTANQGTPNTLANKWPVQVTDGTNVMPTADVAARAQFDKITDGTNTAAVKAASTAAVATDPSLVVGFSPNSALPTGANTIGIVNQGTAASLANAWSTKITDATNGPAAVKAASTAAVAADPALVVAISPNNTLPIQVADVTATGALGALNANVQLTLAGHATSGFQLAAGTLVGTILAETSFDGGTTWTSTYIDTGNKVSTIVFGSANTATSATIVGVGGAGLVRVRVSAYTSGTANITIRASVVNDPSVVYAGLAGATVQPPTASQIAGWDNATTTLRVPAVKAASTASVVGDQALVVTISPNSAALQVTTTASGAVPGNASGYTTQTSTANVAQSATTYTEQSANFTGSVKSSSANDTSAGTGARTITIYYVDATGATAGNEVATLNGTTAVNLVTTTKCFIEKIIVTTVGSGGQNAGIISLFTGAAGAGTTVATIAVGDNQTYLGHHYVVSSKTCNITGITGINNSTSQNTVFTLQAITLPVANQPSVQVSDWVSGSQTQQIVRLYDQLIKVPGPARIQLFGANGGTPSIKSQGSFDYYDQ